MSKIRFYFVPPLIELQRMANEASDGVELEILFDAECGSIRMILLAFEGKKVHRLVLTRPRDPENVPLESMRGIPSLVLVDFGLRGRALVNFLRNGPEELTLAKCAVRVEELQELLSPGCGLQALCLNSCLVIGQVAIQHSLKRLEVQGCSPGFDSPGKSILDTLNPSKLEFLGIVGQNLNNQQAASILRRCGRLRGVNLGRNILTDAISQELAQHFYLEEINLAGNQLTDDCLVYLRDIRRLKRLDLTGNSGVSKAIATTAGLHFQIIYKDVPQADNGIASSEAACAHGKARCSLCQMRLQMLRSLDSIGAPQE